MNLSDGIWDKLGEINEDETLHVLTKLFITYETQHKVDPDNVEAHNFFKNLDSAIEQTTQCNLKCTGILDRHSHRLRGGSLTIMLHAGESRSTAGQSTTELEPRDAWLPI